MYISMLSYFEIISSYKCYNVTTHKKVTCTFASEAPTEKIDNCK